MPRNAEALLTEGRKESSVAGVVARATVCAHRGEWRTATQLFHEAAARRIEVEPAYSLAVLVHTSRYLLYRGSYAEAAQHLDAAAAEATATLPHWQQVIALFQCELAARRGEQARAQFHIARSIATDAHIFPQEAVARATLCAALDDMAGRLHHATPALASEALDRAQPVIAASLLHLASFEPPEWNDTIFCRLVQRTISMLSSDLAALPFLSTVARQCCSSHSSIASARLDAAAAHDDAPAPAAFAALARAFTAQRADRADEAMAHAERATRQFQAIGDDLYARKAMDFIVSERPRTRVSNSPPPLTRRQSEIVALVQRGLSNKEIAIHLHISEHTVERHLTAIFTKLNLRSRYQLPQ